MDEEQLQELEAQIKAEVDEWSSNSNECFAIDIVRGDGSKDTFRPEFTYPIFGEEEAIFGYQVGPIEGQLASPRHYHALCRPLWAH